MTPAPEKKTSKKRVIPDTDMVQVYKDGDNTHQFPSGFNKGYNKWGYEL
jgi:hypothetical protein